MSEYLMLAEQLKKEMEWVHKIIRRRLDLLFGKVGREEYRDEEFQLRSRYVKGFEIETILPPPPYETSFSEFIKDHKLDFYERFLLSFTLSCQLNPEFFNEAMEHPEAGREGAMYFVSHFPQTGLLRDPALHRFIPSGLTFLFIVAGNDLEKKLSLLPLLSLNGVLIKEKVIFLEKYLPGSPFYSGKLLFSEEYFSIFTSAKIVSQKINEHA
jgi:hypothetical protein